MKEKKIYYAEASYSQDEINAIIKVLEDERHTLMSGKKVIELEKKVSSIFNKDYGVMVNSGSSANLLAIKSLKLKEGSKIITPSLTFSTTISPIVEAKLIPLFIDVEKETLQVNTEIFKDIDLDNVTGIFVPNLIGNIANWEDIYTFAKENNLVVIEDSADTIGYTYKTTLNNWSDISTTSFYASHVITGAGFGGMVTYNNISQYEYALSLRGWGRRSSLYGETEDYERRFNSKINQINYDDKFIFDDLAYNFLPSEISAAFALVQLEKLDKNIQKRSGNYFYLKNILSDSENFHVPTSYSNVETGWLAFPFILKNKLASKRKEMQMILEKSGIQTRTIFTGNIMKQPVAKKFKWESFGTFNVSNEVMKSGILIGCHNSLSKDDLEYMGQKLLEAERILSNC